MTATVLHLVAPDVDAPDRDRLTDGDGLAVTAAATRAAAVERVGERGVDCVVAEGDADWLFDAVAAVRERAGPLPVVVRSGEHDPALSVACSRRPGVEYLPRADEDATDAALCDRVRALARDGGDAARRRALDRLHGAVDGDAPLAERVRTVLAAGCAYLGVDVGFLSTIDAAAGRFEVLEARGDHERIQPDATSPLGTTYCRRAIDVDGVLAVADAPAEGWEGDPAYERFGLGCYLGARVTVDGQLYGTLCFADEAPRERPFSADEAAFLELAAGWLGDAIERATGGDDRGARQVLSRVSDGFFAVDEDWTVTYVNDRFEEILGVAADELLGEDLWESFPDAVERDFYDEYHRAMTTQEPVEFEEYFPPLETWFSVRAYPDESGLSVYFRDVTEQKTRERTLAERERVLRGMYRVVARKDATLEEKVDELLAIGRDALDVEYAALSRVEGTDYVFEHVQDPTGGTEPGDVVPLGATNCERAIATEETLVLADVAADAPELTDRAGFTDMGIRCYLGTPVEVDGDVVGTFCFYDDQPREAAFSDWQVTLVELLGNWVSHERERRRRRRELEEFETVLETLEEPVYAVDDELRFSLVTEPLAERLGVDRAALLGEPLGTVLDEETAAACRALADGDDVETPLEGLAAPPDGERYPAAVELTPLSGEAFAGGVGTIRDVTERRERARELEFYYELVKEAGVAVAAVDERGELAYVNGAFAALAGTPADALQGTPVWELVPGADASAFADRWRPMDLGDTVAFETRADGVDLEVRATKAEIRGTPYLFGTVADVSSRRDRERALATLQETAGDLLEADDPDAVADCALAAATDILEAPYVAVYRHDRDAGVLEPAAVSEPAREAIELPTYSGDDGLAWRAFVRGEPATYADVTDEDGVYDPETPVGRAMLLPLGTHGVLAVGGPEPGAFPDQDEEFARTLAANVEVALDRADGRQQLRERERELAERTERLEQLDRINTVIRRVAGTVVRESSRDGIERAVADRFAEPFAAAWVGRTDPAGDTVAPSQWVGEGAGPAPGDDPVAVADDGAHPVGAAVATGEVQVRDGLLEGGDDAAWRRRALAAGHQSCCAVPFAHEGVTRGALMLYAREPDAFPEPVREVLAELGTVIGYALTATERGGALATPGVTELAFDATGADLPVARLADALDCRVAFKRVDDPTASSPAVTYALEGGPDDPAAAVADRQWVRSARSVAVDGEAALLEVTLAAPWYGATFAEEGGGVVAAEAGADGATLTARLPSGIDVRRVVESFRTAHPGVRLTAQRERDPPPAEPLELSRALSSVLTDRQRAALEAAYHGGYFDRPRKLTGSEVAELLDISQPTFSEHLRLAERRAFALLLDGEGLD